MATCSALIVASGIAHGQDIGVESEGFVPRRFRYALVADRLPLAIVVRATI